MYDLDFTGEVTIEETLQIMYVRHGRENLDSEIVAIFGTDETNEDGSEKTIRYQEYLDKINERALANFQKSKDVKVSDGVDAFNYPISKADLKDKAAGSYSAYY